MPPKRPRSSSEASLDDDERRKAAASWAALPTEIKQIIVELACFDSSPDAAALWRTLPHVDTPTLLSLSLIDRDFHCLIRPVQYRQINVTTVSALWGLHGALLARPELGKAIKSLRVGPVSTSTAEWWPIVVNYHDRGAKRSKPFHGLITSLGSDELPLGCEPGQAWPVDWRAHDSCRNVFIWKTLETMQCDLNADLTKGMTGPGGASLPTLEQALLCQAALDLYLLKIREMENEDPELGRRAHESSDELPFHCYHHACGHYPHFVIKDPASGHQRWAPEDALEVTVAQLLQHIARKGAVTDHFDHPLHFARSRVGQVGYMTIESFGPTGKVWTERFFKCIDTITPVERHAAVHPMTPSASTNLRLARELLSLAPNVENLSLAGYLEQVFCQEAKLPNLRRLSIGPSHECLSVAGSFSGLENVQELRLFRWGLSFSEAREIATKMHSLSSVKWALTRPALGQETPLVRHALYGFLGWDVPDRFTTAAAVGSPSHSDGLPSSTEDSPELSEPEPNSFLIEAKLPSLNWVGVLMGALSVAIESAWHQGGPLPNTRCRVRLRRVEDAYDVLDGDLAPSWEQFCEVEHKWWDKFANEPRVSGAVAGVTELGEQAGRAGQSSCGGAKQGCHGK